MINRQLGLETKKIERYLSIGSTPVDQFEDSGEEEEIRLGDDALQERLNTADGHESATRAGPRYSIHEAQSPLLLPQVQRTPPIASVSNAKTRPVLLLNDES